MKPDTDLAQTGLGPALSAAQLDLMNAWWRAANYLSVGQVYLLDNPLLREKLVMEHVKKRLLGHWGTVPGLNFLYVHLNRVSFRRIGLRGLQIAADDLTTRAVWIV